MQMENTKIAILGLGYVGLPLAVAFSKYFPTIGFDIKKTRIEELMQGKDNTREVSEAELAAAPNLAFSCNEEDLKAANVLIVTVPTPIDDHRQPDLTPLVKASEMLGRVINKGDVVIYESTVYPGATEEECIPVVEKVSGLVFNQDFYAGYSPERINPGDKERPVTKIMKVTSGSTPEIADFVDQLYGTIIEAGTHKASSIKVAEASKIIENTQRDVNIALINELAMIFSHLGIDTNDVIEAAATKWNFIKLQPGLVGGHCIGVDPYYLVHKSMSVGHIPDMIRKAREINDGMARFVASKLIKAMIEKSQLIKGAKVLVMGMTFKENCPDIRNSKVVDLIKELKSYGLHVDVYDPWVDKNEAKEIYGLDLISVPKKNYYDAVVVTVKHNEFVQEGRELFSYCKEIFTFVDIKKVVKACGENIIYM
ncbi:nucleotide sugar dehydrogenase [Halomonas sp. TD01]|uniref:nucleotide sugar dehydrogenase n=1 Tax=Halomonas sp. TD01 TaxID=999141 RepID=UPI000214DE76|nr:nucleotide sugar dehydrogenase [Halomonas sp. TD01]EGP21221.1 UDP-glucose dehydrogenase [Halomonas sp. TD01]CAH1043977.1 UDP-N-acetyl-D-glucosamine 6-dehydrogenase (EC [Halomonas sp. TD01]